MSFNALDVIINRKSTRIYDNKVITDKQIRQLLLAGMSAPSCANSCDWEFIVIWKKQTLIDISESLEGKGRMLPNASVGIIVCVNLERSYKKFPEYWIIDCTAAAENILIAADGLGFGGVFLGVFPETICVNSISAYFDLPSTIKPLVVISFGYPAERRIAGERYYPEKVHFEKW